MRLGLAGVAAVCLGLLGGVPLASGAAEPLLGIEAIETPLPVFDGRQQRHATAADELPPLEVWLSRDRYWQQDGHLDVIVRLSPSADAGLADSFLRVRIRDGSGDELSRFDIVDLPGWQFAFYASLPAGWVGRGEVELSWLSGEREIAREVLPFRVERFDEPVGRTGRVRIELRNDAGVSAAAMPVTFGVPFPRGALADVAHLRLVDEQGEVIPLQVLETARWSKFGSLRWVLGDFLVTLTGGEQTYFLEYDSTVRRPAGAPIIVTKGAGFPVIDAGRLRIDDGLWYDVAGDGRFVKVLDAAALVGAFVEHEDGRLYRPAADGSYEVEELGSEKVVIRREGWYREVDGEREFCRYVISWVIHRDSPFVRIFHTWIYTGDSSLDRIANMGWGLPLSDGVEPGEFLSGFGEDGQWLAGDYLLQYEPDGFEVVGDGRVESFPGGRAVGVARASGDGAALYLGVRDFWQHYPSELEFRDGALWFHSWPRHGKPQPEPLVDVETAQLLKFAHSGEVLDFRLPEAFTEDPLDHSHHRGLAGEGLWLKGVPESVDAQGVARTEEFWLYVAPTGANDEGVARLLGAVNDERLLPVVDTRWVAQSGVFGEISAQDPDLFPNEEQTVSAVAEFTGERGTRMGIHGMWLHGERAWNSLPHSNLYRGLLKAHRGFPYSWVPYARSGDPSLLNYARVDSRRVADTNYCHYVGDRASRIATGRHNIERAIGPWSPGPLPWAASASPMVTGKTGLQPKRNHLWHSWYMTGYRRGLDLARSMDEAIKQSEGVLSGGMGSRGNDVHLKNALLSFQNNHDPWFMVRARNLAREQREAWANNRWQPYGNFWTTGESDYHRFTGSEPHGDYFLEIVNARAGTRAGPLAYAWHISGDELYLRRIVGILSESQIRGVLHGSNFLHDFPPGIGAMASVDELPPGLFRPFFQRRREYLQSEDGTFIYRTPAAVLYKEEGQALRLFIGTIRLQTYQRESDEHRYWITGPDGDEFLAGSLAINTFENQPGEYIEIPADAPGGVYRVEAEVRSIHANSIHGHSNLRGIRFPISAPGVPEVIEIDEQAMGPASTVLHAPPGYFFYVPEDVTEFSVTRVYSHYGPKILNPDGAVVWQTGGAQSGNAHIEVPPEHRGKLWRIVGANFTMDPQIPPYYAVDPDRWFNPESAVAGE